MCFNHWLNGSWCKWNSSVCVRLQSALTQSPVPNQCKTNDQISLQSAYKLDWQECSDLMISLKWTHWVSVSVSIARENKTLMHCVFLELKTKKKVLSRYWFTLSFNYSCDLLYCRHLACTVQQSSVFWQLGVFMLLGGRELMMKGGLDLSSHNI